MNMNEFHAYQNRTANEISQHIFSHIPKLKPVAAHVNWLRNLAHVSTRIQRATQNWRDTSEGRLAAGQKPAVHHLKHLLKLAKKGPSPSSARKFNSNANLMRGSARALVKLGIKELRDKDSHISDRHSGHAMRMDDAADHLKIGMHMNTGQHKKASNVADSMDTEPRERIPLKTWKAIKISKPFKL